MAKKKYKIEISADKKGRITTKDEFGTRTHITFGLARKRIDRSVSSAFRKLRRVK